MGGSFYIHYYISAIYFMEILVKPNLKRKIRIVKSYFGFEINRSLKQATEIEQYNLTPLIKFE